MDTILEGIFEDCFKLDFEYGPSKHFGHDEQLERFKKRISSKDKLPYNQAVYIFDEKSGAREKFCELIYDNNLLNEEDFSHLIYSVHVMRRGYRGLVDWCGIEKTILMMKKAKTPYILGDKAGKTFDNLKSDFEIYRGTREMEKDKAEKGIC